ncbi:MAG: M20/M25/M40 family metallo-hydrolase, partial [Candidatus Zixiibacteriota bacterium]
YIPAKSDTTIVIGAHYDHLGWGAEGSRYTGSEKMIHNGADDNASGTAAVMELARYFVSRNDQLKHSLLFCAFSGEESGLLGSNYFSKNMTINPHTVRMMINFDMVGRLKDQESGLAVFGVGTTAEFGEYFKTVDTTDLKIVMKEPGTGPSDHTSFYNQNIPVLHFFTGAHNDYHKPSDDVEFIDIPGTHKVIHFAAETIEHFDQLEKELAFQKTVDPNAGRMSSSFSVTLGVMPDYIAEVKGMRIDGVSSNRPAERAGLKAGDVLIEMGGMPVTDIYDYMGCLSKFRLHDTTKVVVQRGEEKLTLTVIFE